MSKHSILDFNRQGGAADRPAAPTADVGVYSPPVSDAEALAGWASEANDCVDAADRAGVQQLLSTREAGEHLAKAKAVVKHGQWLVWCRDNLRFSIRKMQVCLEIHEGWDAIEERMTTHPDEIVSTAGGLAYLKRLRDDAANTQSAAHLEGDGDGGQDTGVSGHDPDPLTPSERPSHHVLKAEDVAPARSEAPGRIREPKVEEPVVFECEDSDGNVGEVVVEDGYTYENAEDGGPPDGVSVRMGPDGGTFHESGCYEARRLERGERFYCGGFLMTPDEARGLAAALIRKADEIEAARRQAELSTTMAATA